MPMAKAIGILSLSEKSFIAGEYLAGAFFEFVHQIFNSKIFLIFTANIQNDTSFMHHNESIAVGNGVAHIVGDHQGCQMILVDDAVCGVQNLGSGFGSRAAVCSSSSSSFGFIRVAIINVRA